ncbi:MAG: hypothetical protein PHX68_04370 [Alphaproteobacteria bacterium]|nr:hypothetical protein [Alphaproteobacteria bacterium]
MKHIFLTLICLLPVAAAAQMVETIGGLGVQGALVQSSARDMGLATSLLQENKIISELMRLEMEIRTSFFGRYQNIDRTALNTPWDVGGDNNQFYIIVPNLNQAACRRLAASRIDARKVINNQNDAADACSAANQIKFIFE